MSGILTVDESCTAEDVRAAARAIVTGSGMRMQEAVELTNEVFAQHLLDLYRENRDELLELGADAQPQPPRVEIMLLEYVLRLLYDRPQKDPLRRLVEQAMLMGPHR